MSEDILNKRTIAEYLKVPEKTVYGLAQKRKIPCFKVRGQRRRRAVYLPVFERKEEV